MFVLMILGLSVLYRYGRAAVGEMALDQHRQRLRRPRLARGVFAVLLVPQNLANYNATYRGLGAVVGLMMWMWLSIIVVLVVRSSTPRSSTRPHSTSTVGLAKPLGVPRRSHGRHRRCGRAIAPPLLARRSLISGSAGIPSFATA